VGLRFHAAARRALPLAGWLFAPAPGGAPAALGPSFRVRVADLLAAATLAAIWARVPGGAGWLCLLVAVFLAVAALRPAVPVRADARGLYLGGRRWLWQDLVAWKVPELCPG